MDRKPRQCPSCKTWCGPNTPYCHCTPQSIEKGELKSDEKVTEICSKCSGTSGICRDCAKK